jgi:hypothetical protein
MMRYFILIILIYFFNINLLSAKPHEYNIFAFKLESESVCPILTNVLLGFYSAEEGDEIISNAIKNNMKNNEVPAPSFGVPRIYFDDSGIARDILDCLYNKNIIKETCGKNHWELNGHKAKKCLNKIKIFYEKKDKKRLKIQEKCIKKAKDMKTESAFKMMYANCMKQNNY